MLGIENYWIFIISGILLNLTPGSDTIYILSRSIAQGKKAGIISVFGISSGIIVHTLFASFGLSLILVNSKITFNIVKYAGAAYLVYLGIKSIRTRSNQDLLENSKADSMVKIYFQGLITNLLNPKVALFFLAYLPQFINTNNNYGPIPFLILGLTFVTTATIWTFILAVFSSTMSKKIRNNKLFSSYLQKLSGVIFIGLGVNLLR